MRRVRYHEYGGPDVLRVEEADVPEPEPGQLRIRADVVGTNFVDTKFRSGAGTIFSRPLPGSLTGDVVGIVDAVGEGVDAGRVGERVAALSEDAVAEYVAVDADWAVPVPEGLDAGAATVLPTMAPVAAGVLGSGRLAEGETVLVYAAAGGIGHLAVQLARARGAGTVIAAAGSAAKLDFARGCGADAGVDYTEPDWTERVRELAPGGVDVVLDAVGGRATLDGVGLLAPYGRLVIYGAASGGLPVLPMRELYVLKQASGFSLLAWRQTRPDEVRRETAAITGHLASGRLRVAVHATLPFAHVAEAYRLLDDRAQIGRILLIP